jgi:hypothetical protein
MNWGEHECSDGPDLAPYDVRSCTHWYGCEKPIPEDAEHPSDVLVIDNLNYSNVVDDSDGYDFTKRVTIYYDHVPLKRLVLKHGAIRMTFIHSNSGNVYPYALVRFPTVKAATAAFRELQGVCLGHSGRHLRPVFIDPYDHTYGGRNMTAMKETLSVITAETKSIATKRKAAPKRLNVQEHIEEKPKAPAFRRAKNGMRVKITGLDDGFVSSPHLPTPSTPR